MGRVPEGAVAVSVQLNIPSPIAGQKILKKKAFAHVRPDRTRANPVTKSAETRGRWARGSGAKMRRYNGACCEIVLGESYTPTKPGNVRLKISKDRNGGVGAIGATAFELHFAPKDFGGTEVTWALPTAPENWRP